MPSANVWVRLLAGENRATNDTFCPKFVTFAAILKEVCLEHPYYAAIPSIRCEEVEQAMGKRLLVTMMVVAFLMAACSQSATSLATRPASEPMTASTPRFAPSWPPSPLYSSEGTPTVLMSPTNTPTPASVETPPTDTPAPTTTPAGPRIFSFAVSPAEVDPGDVVVLAWEASGDWAMICPDHHGSDYCRQVPLSGTMTFAIPNESYRISEFILLVNTHASTTSTTKGVPIKYNCHTAWFFSDEMHTHGCPQEAIRSYAAVQYFEGGAMIWIAQIGRYFILEETLLYQGDVRKRAHYLNDPLEINRDTSAEVRPPDGLYAPESGFGLVWRGDVSNSPGYRESLGWAVAREFGYEAVYQCDPGQVTGGRFWQRCYLTTPDNKVVFLHPLGGWYALGEQ
jgi:hypothetical protein